MESPIPGFFIFIFSSSFLLPLTSYLSPHHRSAFLVHNSTLITGTLLAKLGGRE